MAHQHILMQRRGVGDAKAVNACVVCGTREAQIPEGEKYALYTGSDVSAARSGRADPDDLVVRTSGETWEPADLDG